MIYDPEELATSVRRNDAYQELLRENPVHYSETLGAWIVTRHESVRQVLLDTERFSAVGSIGISGVDSSPPEVRAVLETGFSRFPGIIEMDPPQHKVYRNLISAAFTPRRVAGLESRFRSMAEDLIDGFIDQGEGDFIPLFAFPYPMRVISSFLGIPEEDIPEIDRMSDGFRDLEAGTLFHKPVDEQVASAQNFVDFQNYAARLVEDRRRTPEDDLISLMLQEELPEGRPVSTEEAISTVIHLLFAGHETNARLLGTLMHQLLSVDGRWERLVNDTSLIASTVEEGLRLGPPVTYHSRTTLTKVAIDGVAIPGGSEVHLVFAAANRDPHQFPEPDAFSFERSNVRQHLGFGLGIHYCVGAPVARLESQVALETLASRMPNLRLREDFVPTHEPHAMLHGLTELLVEWG